MFRPKRRPRASAKVLEKIFARVRELYPRTDTDPGAAQEFAHLVGEVTRQDDSQVWLTLMDVLSALEAERRRRETHPEAGE